MRSVIRECGNGAAVRIPARDLQDAGLRLGQEVDVRVERGSIILQPVGGAAIDVAALLDGITPDNLHGEIATGEDLGREGWA